MMIDLRAFRGVYYDLDEIGLALAREEIGAEVGGRARKAVERLRVFLTSVPRLQTGLLSDLSIIDRCLARQMEPPRLFDVAGLSRRLERARDSHRQLRGYLEGLEMAWRVCAMDSGLADQAAGLAGVC